MWTINPKFKLKDSKNTSSLVLMHVFYNKKRFVYSTGLKVKTKYWHKKKGKIIYSGSNASIKQDQSDTNDILAKYANRIKEIFNHCHFSSITPTNEYLKNEMDKTFRPGKSPGSMSLIQYIDYIVKISKDGSRLTRNGKRISEKTIKAYVTTKNHLVAYQDKMREKVDFDRINQAFYNRLLKYFNEEGMATNSIGTHIKNLKVFMSEATKEGINKNLAYQDDGFIKVSEDTPQIYLNEEEIKKIYKLNLSYNPKLDRVRDTFIIGCCTGLRYSDLQNLKESNIVAKGTRIKVWTQKTGEMVEIPLHWMVKEILKKYGGQPPASISNQKTNEYLKDIGKLAKINSIETTRITRGGMPVEATVNKHRLITVHTARRSFATNMYLADVPTISIMRVTGHKTEKAFMKYIRFDQEDNANKLIDHPFFTKKSELKVVK